MEILPILRAMWRSPTGALLVAMQIAITLAIVINAVLFIHSRIQHVQRPNGMQTQNIIVIKIFGIGRDYHASNVVRRDIATLMQIPGVISASFSDSVPLSGSGSSNQ